MPKPSLNYDLVELRGLQRFGELNVQETCLVADLITMHNENARLRNQITDLHWRVYPEAHGR